MRFDHLAVLVLWRNSNGMPRATLLPQSRLARTADHDLLLQTAIGRRATECGRDKSARAISGVASQAQADWRAKTHRDTWTLWRNAAPDRRNHGTARLTMCVPHAHAHAQTQAQALHHVSTRCRAQPCLRPEARLAKLFTDSHTRRCPLEDDEATPTRGRATELPQALRCNQLLRMACVSLGARRILDMHSLLKPTLTPRSGGRSRWSEQRWSARSR